MLEFHRNYDFDSLPSRLEWNNIVKKEDISIYITFHLTTEFSISRFKLSSNMKLTNKCCVCQDAEHAEEARFSFPVNEERRLEWLKILGLVNKPINKTARLCPRHFVRSDIKVTPKGIHRLIPGANPIPYIADGKHGHSLFPCDVTLVSASFDEYHVHRVILACHSTFFKNILNTEQEKFVIFLPETSSKVVRALIDVLYSGECCVAREDIVKFRDLLRDLKINNFQSIGFRKGKKRKVSEEETHSTKSLKTVKCHQKVDSDHCQNFTQTNNNVNNLDLGTILKNHTLDKVSKPFHVRGLKNRSNFCFMNSILQSLNACTPFHNMMKTLASMIHQDRNVSTLSSMIQFIKEYSNRSAGILEPKTIKLQNKQLLEGRQEDAEEFLLQLLNDLSEEMSSEIGDDTSLNPIQAIMQGTWRSTLRTGIEEAEYSHTLQKMFIVQLDIKNENVSNLSDALVTNFGQPEKVDYICSSTGLVIEATKTSFLEKLAPVLIIQFKRFQYDERVRKTMKEIKFERTLNVPDAVLSDNSSENGAKYELFSVINHIGNSSQNGHYISNVLHPDGWLQCNDARITPVHEESVLSPSSNQGTPYLLFYRRLENSDQINRHGLNSSTPVAVTSEGLPNDGHFVQVQQRL